MIQKVIVPIIAACLLTTCANAVVNRDRPDTFFEPGTRYLCGSNAFARMTGDKGEVLCDADGNDLTGEGMYKQITAVDPNSFIVTGFDEKKGVIAANGTEIIAPAYDFISVKDNWAIGFNYAEADEDDFSLIDPNDDGHYLKYAEITVYHLDSGTPVETDDRNSYFDHSIEKCCLNIEDPEGVVHSYAPDGTSADVYTDRVDDFEWSVPYLGLYYNEDGCLVGLCEKNGTPITDPVYAGINVMPGKDIFDFANKDYMFGLITADGNEIVEARFTGMLTVDYGVYGYNGVYAGCNDYDDTITLIDTVNGTEYTADRSEMYDCVFDGCALLVRNGDGTCAVITANGTETPLPEGYDWNAIGRGIYTAYCDDGVIACDMNGDIILSAAGIFLTPDGHIVADVADGLMVFKP